MSVLPRGSDASRRRVGRQGRRDPQEPGPADAVASMTQIQRPSLITNPADDFAFRDDAEAILQGRQSIDEFQTVLRRDYPRAIVRSRDLAGERQEVWYVYRDGHWVARHDRGEG
jgi:hypothetical protein